jgi:hypothetical protein
MPTSIKSGFASKVIHFDVKYHMAGYLLVTNWRRLPIKQDFEGNPNVLHFLGAKFMGLFQITGVLLSYKRNNAVPLPQDTRNPPVESWFMVNAKDVSIFGCFNRVRLLMVSKVLPRCRAIFSLAAKLPTNG